MQPPFALALLAGVLLIAGTIIGLALGFVGDFKDPSSYHLTALFSGVLGGATIMGAVSFITWREAVQKRRQVTPTEPETKV